MGRIYHWLVGLFKRKRRLSIAEFERTMRPHTRAQLEKEVAFLRSQRVSVQALAEGEAADKPKPANPADEVRLPPLTGQEEPPSTP